MTHQQIAELLGIEPHTSSSQLLRAKRQLRQLLQVLMLFLLAAIPFGGYYLWSLQNNKHDVAEVSDDAQKETRDVAKENLEDAEETPSSQAIAITDTIVNMPQKAITNDAKVANKQNASPVGLDTAERNQDRPTAKAEDVEKQEKDITMDEIGKMEMTDEEAHKKMTVQDTENTDITGNVAAIPQGQIVLPSPTSDTKLFLSLAYNGLPNGDARQLPYGIEGENGDIDSVSHHRMPVSIVLNARYTFGTRWWLDGGLRYTQLSSETRVGNTYLYMEQQQNVRYLGLSLGVGYDLWHKRHWNLYSTASVSYELPLRSTTEISYWQGGMVIETEKNRLTPHTQWSVGMGLGLQYDLTPSIGFFAEPNLQYYFHNSDGIKTWRSEHPFTPMLPLGIRISF